jgi:hypothetical protein
VRTVRQSRQTPPKATAGVWHVETARDRAVLKLLCNGGDEGRWPARSEESDPYYWRREALAYASGAIDRFGVPEVLACVERTDGSIALWLEDCGEAPPTRTLEEAFAIAQRLGAAQALPVPDAPWLARGFLREYLRLHDIDDDCADLEALPEVLCHNDFHPGNVLAGGAVIDWAYCGLGAAGLDAGVLLADGIADAVFPAEQADEFAAAVWSGYTGGLGRGDAQIRRGFVAGARRLRWLPFGREAAWDATIALIERLASEG